MTDSNVYVPGVCNIGPAEIRRRRLSGRLGLALAVVFLVVAFALAIPAPWRALVALPAGLAAAGFLQAGFRFCAGFGIRGLFNFGDVGVEEEVHEAEFRRKDQRKAMLIGMLSFLIAALAAVVAVVIPFP